VNDKYNFELAASLLEQKDYGQLWEYALPYAQAEDSDAQCLISLLYECGFGVRRDIEEAERWLRKAVEKDNPVAWNNLGTLLTARRNFEEAKRCYQRAASLGFTMSAPLAKAPERQ
jgi:TPR repeat protein